MSDTDKDRLTDLEIMLSHQAEQISDLSEMVEQQWKEIKFLKNKLSHAEDKLSELQDSLPGDGQGLSPSEIAARDKPPHY